MDITKHIAAMVRKTMKQIQFRINHIKDCNCCLNVTSIKYFFLHFYIVFYLIIYPKFLAYSIFLMSDTEIFDSWEKLLITEVRCSLIWRVLLRNCGWGLLMSNNEISFEINLVFVLRYNIERYKKKTFIDWFLGKKLRFVRPSSKTFTYGL